MWTRYVFDSSLLLRFFSILLIQLRRPFNLLYPRYISFVYHTLSSHHSESNVRQSICPAVFSSLLAYSYNVRCVYTCVLPRYSNERLLLAYLILAGFITIRHSILVSIGCHYIIVVVVTIIILLPQITHVGINTWLSSLPLFLFY